MSREVEEDASAQEGFRSGDEDEETRAELPLVVVSFEQAARGERPAQANQPARTRMFQALADVQATLCVAPRRLGRIKGEYKETSTAKTVSVRGEGGKEPQLYVPNWPQVRKNSNLASTEEKMEWLLNCVLLGVSMGYDTLGVGSVIELGIQLALLVMRHIDRRV